MGCAATAAGDLDQVLRLLRDTVFGLEQRLRDRGLPWEIMDLCKDLSPVPEVTFTGPVDGALHPGTGIRPIQLLREALAIIGHNAVPASIGVTAGEDCLTEVTPLPHAADADWTARQSAVLHEQAARAGPASTSRLSRTVSGSPGACR